MLPLSPHAAAALYNQDRRKSARVFVGEEAELVIPVEAMTLPCLLVNLSEGGAKVACDAIPPPGTAVELVLKNGRRIAAVTAWIHDDTLGLRFTGEP